MFKKALLGFLLVSLPALPQVSGTGPAVLTGQYNSSRTSANLGESVLTTANVNTTQFGKLFSWSVDGQVRAQPLYVPGVVISGRTRNVVYVATMHNSIYAFDADNPGSAALWKVNFGASVTAPTANGCPQNWSTGPELGVLSTPVIDASAGTLYATSASPSGGGYVHYIHALDIQTGKDRPGSPTLIQASVPGTGYNAQGGTVSMGPASEEIQRTSLLLANGSVYAGFGNCGPDHDPYHGWVIGYSAANVQNQTALFNTTPNGGQGGIWQSARGLAVDGGGNVYFATGNATPSNATTGTASGDAALSDYSMRLLQLSSSGQFLASFPPPDYSNLNAYDLDFSSSGPMVLTGSNYVIAGGKDGLMYVFRAGNLTSPVQTFRVTGDAPCSYTFTGCDQIHDLAFWNNHLYIWGTSDVLRTFNLVNGQFNTTAASRNTQSFTTAPTLAVSANGSQSGSGIVWATTSDSVVHAYNAENVASELWNSNQNSGRDALPSFSRFTEPTVANGRVYVATQSNQVTVYGLLSDFSLSTGSASTKSVQGSSAAATVTINVTPLAGYSGAVNLSVSGLPSGVRATFTPSSITGSGSSTLSISADPSVPMGTYNLIVTGQGGGETRTTNLTYIVASNDITAPTWSCCTYTFDGNSYTMTFTAQDTGSGLQSITATQLVDATVSIPNFPAGTTSPVTFTATESGYASYVTFQVTDVAGNITTIDPAYVDFGRAKGKPVGYPVQGITQADGILTLINGNPGLKNVRIEVGQGQTSSKLQVAGLHDGEVRVVSIFSLLPPADVSGTSGTTGSTGATVTITPLGKPGGTAFFVFAPTPMSGGTTTQAAK